MGEVTGVFGRAHRQKRITGEGLDEVTGKFSNETSRIKKIGRIKIITLSEGIMEKSWDVVIKTISILPVPYILQWLLKLDATNFTLEIKNFINWHSLQA